AYCLATLPPITCLRSIYSPCVIQLPSPHYFSPLPPTSPSTLFPYTTLFRSIGRPGNVTSIASRASFSSKAFSSKILYFSSIAVRSEEHTSELQSRFDLVCRLLLEKKKRL